jgi:hypothetical protein
MCLAPKSFVNQPSCSPVGNNLPRSSATNEKRGDKVSKRWLNLVASGTFQILPSTLELHLAPVVLQIAWLQTWRTACIISSTPLQG